MAKRFPNLMKTINHRSKKLSELQAQNNDENHNKADHSPITLIK